MQTLGIKLASFLQPADGKDILTQGMLRVLNEATQGELRLLAAKNLCLDSRLSISKFILRLRDRNEEIAKLVFLKML